LDTTAIFGEGSWADGLLSPILFPPCHGKRVWALSSKQGHPYTHPSCSPKVTAESQRFPVTRKNNKDWSLVHFLPETAVSANLLLNSLHVEQGWECRVRGKRAIVTDLLPRASCFLFFPLAGDVKAEMTGRVRLCCRCCRPCRCNRLPHLRRASSAR
jgi:hypothetical protein